MATRSLNKEDPDVIRMVFQRLIAGEHSIHVTYGVFKGDFKVLGEAPDRVILGISDVERGQWRLKPGAHLTLKLADRGLAFEAVVGFQGHGKSHGIEACHVSVPRLLRALDSHRLAEFVPDKGLPCSFADQHNDVKDGLGLAFGEEGLELAPPEGTKALGEVLRLNAASTVELHASAEEHLVLPVRVAYFGEGVWGLRIADAADRHVLGRYRQWLMEAQHGQAQRDLAHFSPGGSESPRLSGQREAPKATPQVKLLVDRDPMVLVLAEGDAFPEHLAGALGRKIGVAALDLGPGPLRPALAGLGVEGQDWGRIRLVLIHHHIRSISALERCRRLTQGEGCPLPILLAGTEEDADLKRNRALAAGALDHLVVEPFHVLSILRVLEDTLRLFA